MEDFFCRFGNEIVLEKKIQTLMALIYFFELGVLGTGNRNWWSRSQNFEEEKKPMDPQNSFLS